jgi:hypothetical protein
MRKTITIPENPKYFPLTGSSIIIESAGLYSGVEQVPLISFDNASADFPVYPHSVYQNPEGNFNRILIEPTPESAGDEITILSFDECLESNLNIAFSGSKKTNCGTTFSITSTDAGQSLSSLQIQKNGLLPTAMYISAENANINYAFDTIADQSSNNHSLAATITENATGSIEPTALPASDEIFNIIFYGQSVEVSILEPADTLQIFSNKIRDALKGNSAINNDFSITNATGANVPVSINAKKSGVEYNSEITATNTDAEMTIVSPKGGQSQKGEMIKIVGIDFIQKFTFASAAAGFPADLVLTTEY